MAAPSLYDARFSPAERRAKDAVWQVLCADFFQRYVPADATVVDLGAGFCEFINHIRAREKWAVETDARVRELAAPGVRVHSGPAHDLGWLPPGSVDVDILCQRGANGIDEVDASFAWDEGEGDRSLECWRRAHTDYFTRRGEFSPAMELYCERFRVVEVRPRFLPYTTKSALPSWPVLVKLYLRLPLLHRLLGKQMFLVAVRP